MRIGHGYDAHCLVEGRPLILGGVAVPHSRGLEGHSDGDVVLHALCDALLGAAGLGDLGRFFPDSDPRLQGIDSRVLLREVAEKLRSEGFELGNADVTIVAQQPRMAPHVEAMTRHIAADLGVSDGRINVKATSTDGMGFSGREEGIAATALVLINHIQ